MFGQQTKHLHGKGREEDLAPKFISKFEFVGGVGFLQGLMEWKVQVALHGLGTTALLRAAGRAGASGCLGLRTHGAPPAAAAEERSIPTLEDSNLSHFFVSCFWWFWFSAIFSVLFPLCTQQEEPLAKPSRVRRRKKTIQLTFAACRQQPEPPPASHHLCSFCEKQRKLDPTRKLFSKTPETSGQPVQMGTDT